MNRIKKLITSIVKKSLMMLPTKKQIVFESAPDLSDNTKAVFDEMIKRNLNEKYKMIWLHYDETESLESGLKNVKIIKTQNLLPLYYMTRAKCVICCNRLLFSQNKRTVNFYLGHGNPLKNTKSYFNIPDGYDYILASSEGMRQIRIDFYGLKEEKIYALGYPRNDILTEKSIDLHGFFDADYKKIIVWYPTVRQFKSKGKNATGSIHALPIVWDSDKAIRLNEYAKQHNVLIVLKPHFAQDVSYIKELQLSNIVFIDDSFFKKNKITSYQFVGSCDALLTDFSSIYYDYTLCDKPIGLIWEDYEEYKQRPGFAVDMDYMMKGGEKIYNLEDFYSFIKDVAEGKDRLQEERREIRDFANRSTDGENAERVVDFIIQKARL